MCVCVSMCVCVLCMVYIVLCVVCCVYIRRIVAKNRGSVFEWVPRYVCDSRVYPLLLPVVDGLIKNLVVRET